MLYAVCCKKKYRDIMYNFFFCVQYYPMFYLPLLFTLSLLSFKMTCGSKLSLPSRQCVKFEKKLRDCFINCTFEPLSL